jgi:hypothetical protein
MKIALPGPYDHVMYILEKCYVDCTYAAYAYINGYLGVVYQGENYKYVGGLMHETGHNFGLAGCCLPFIARNASSSLIVRTRMNQNTENKWVLTLLPPSILSLTVALARTRR